MLIIGSAQMSALQDQWSAAWLRSHVETLSGMAPELVAPYDARALDALVARMLCRADLLGVHLRSATVAFCYASLWLGVGFEAQPEHAWAAELDAVPAAAQADFIWDGLEREVSGALGDDR